MKPLFVFVVLLLLFGAIGYWDNTAQVCTEGKYHSLYTQQGFYLIEHDYLLVIDGIAGRIEAT